MARPPTLPVFQDLSIKGPEGELASLRRDLLRHVAAPWSHAQKHEAELARHAGEGNVIVFERCGDAQIAAASLVLWSRADGYEITNIVPIERDELSPGDYNLVLNDFAARIATPAAAAAGFRVQMTGPDQSLEDWLSSAAAAAALRRFSAAANKSTGSSHPMDRSRWFAFLILAHSAERKPDTDQLARWLTEVERWPEERAHTLVIEYEFSLALLLEYDRARP
jgi:hypothetical protein